MAPGVTPSHFSLRHSVWSGGVGSSYEKRLAEIDALVKALYGLGHTDDEIVQELRKHLNLGAKQPRTLGEHIAKSLRNPGRPLTFGAQGDGAADQHYPNIEEGVRKIREARAAEGEQTRLQKATKKASIQNVLKAALDNPGKPIRVGDGFKGDGIT